MFVSAAYVLTVPSLFVLLRRIAIGVVGLPNFSTTWVTKACASFPIQPAMSLAPAAKQGCAMRPLALADNRVVRTALTPVGQLHRETTQGIGWRCR